MPVQDPFEGAKSEGQDQQRALLDAIANAGAAGRKAYEDAQAQVERSRAAALERAVARAQLTGQNLGGADTAAVGESADRFGNYFAGQNAANQSHLGNIGASAQSYLDKISQIAPFLQSENTNKAADREQQIKLAQQANQAKIDADKAAQLASYQHDFDMLTMRNKQAQQSAAQRATSAKAPKLTKAQLLGAGQTLSDEYATDAGMAPGSQGTFSADQSARALAAYRNNEFGDGPDENEVNALLGPRKAAPVAAPQVPQPFDKNYLLGPFRYEGKAITSSRADEVLRAPEVAGGQRVVEILSTQKLDSNGRITANTDERGMTPWQAFETWLDAQPGIRTMKTAMKDYYRPYLTSLEQAAHG